MIEWVIENFVHEAYANGVWCIGCVFKKHNRYYWVLDPMLRGESLDKSSGYSDTLAKAKKDVEIEFRRFIKAAGVKLEKIK